MIKKYHFPIANSIISATGHVSPPMLQTSGAVHSDTSTPRSPHHPDARTI